jgi:hypothetical protein
MSVHHITKTWQASCPRARCDAHRQQARRAGGQVAVGSVVAVVIEPFLISGDIRGRTLFSLEFFGRCNLTRIEKNSTGAIAPVPPSRGMS